MKISYPVYDVHALSVEDVVQSFETNAEKGITASEAENRTRQFGKNTYEAQKQKSIWLILLMQFKSPVVYLLVVAALVTLYLNNYIESGAIGTAVETLGSTNIILTDKTDTLTENTIHADTFSVPAEEIKTHIKNKELKFDAGEIKNSKENFEKLKLIGALCNNATVKSKQEKDKLLGDLVEKAFINLANTSENSADEIKKQHERIGEISFSSETKMMNTLHEIGVGNFVAAKSSVEHLLEKCNRI